MSIRIPALATNIERRLLINYRLDPGVAQSLLPDTLGPQLVRGSAVAGICLLRLGALRPTWFASGIGWGAENAAHRIAVEWDDETGTHQGVYIPERHTASWLPVAAGGRVFPGVQKHAHFEGSETPNRIHVAMTSKDTTVRADVAVSSTFTSGLFSTLDDASAFFRAGSIGWSPARDGHALQCIRLDTDQWWLDAGQAISVESSFFDALPAGAARLDSVLVMRNVPIIRSAPRAIRSRVPMATAF